jgi:hypothetical protein
MVHVRQAERCGVDLHMHAGRAFPRRISRQPFSRRAGDGELHAPLRQGGRRFHFDAIERLASDAQRASNYVRLRTCARPGALGEDGAVQHPTVEGDFTGGDAAQRRDRQIGAQVAQAQPPIILRNLIEGDGPAQLRAAHRRLDFRAAGGQPLGRDCEVATQPWQRRTDDREIVEHNRSHHRGMLG